VLRRHEDGRFDLKSLDARDLGLLVDDKNWLMPLPVPDECWEVVGLDFITGLPISDGFDAIMTCVDRLSKRPKYAATHSMASAVDTARLFFDTVVRHHGLPRAIVSDRDSKFTSDFWSELMRLMGVQLKMTTSYRPQADGQAERQNRVLEDALRCMVSVHGSNWSSLLSAVEFAHATL
jgi:transposase InsO family protein